MMKGKRFAALALTLVMILSLLIVPASAVTFSDITTHWAKSDIETLATQGVIKGYTDGTFKPNNKMTACEALLFCSRATGVDARDKTLIAAHWADEMKNLLPEDMLSWASEEMAVCLETGIISTTELKALTTSGAIVKSISRENLAMYLVRAMQLAPLAQSLSTYPLTFSDTSSISMSMQPYVYLLNMYGIVKGDQANRFMPQGSLTRAEMATMLRRAIDFMAERGIYAELPEYTDYTWVGGTIAAVSTNSGVTLLTLNSDFSGTRSISLPESAKIYESNMLVTASALKVGQYARVNMNNKGTAMSVRVGGTLTSYSGTVSAVSQDSLTMSVGGVTKILDIDRFTEVQVGKTAGDYTLIDPAAGYTNAVCKVDEMGHLASVQFSGGTREQEGLIVSVTAVANGSQTLQVAGFNGVTQKYTVPTGAGITVNGLVGTLQSGYAGKYVSMRVSNDDSGQVLSLNVDSITQYVQGSIRAFTTAKAVNTVTLNDLSTGKSTTYNLLSSAVIQYNGEAIALSKLEKNCFATLRLTGGEISLLDAYPGSTETEGVIEGITYGSPIALSVRLPDDSVITFNLALDDLPTIYRDDKSSSIDKIKTGDTVVVTVRYNTVTQIDATSQSANVTGTITRVVQDSAGVTMDVSLTTGETTQYTVSDGVSVTQDGAAMSVYDLRVNDKVAMVVSSGQVVSIEVSAASGKALTGTVLTTNTKDRTMMVLIDGSSAVTVDVTDANFVDSMGGTLYLGGLKANDTVVVYGSYSGALFKATLVVRT